MIKYSYIIKYLLLFSLGFFLAANQPFEITAYAINKEAQQRSQAKLLTEKGNQQLKLAKSAEALNTFKEATKIYKQLKYDEGITGSLINQSLALQALGLNSRACKILLPALKIDTDDWVCNASSEQSDELIKKLLVDFTNQKPLSSTSLLALHNLGNVLRQLGKLNESEIILEKVLLLSKQIPSGNVSTVLLSLAETKKYTYKRVKDRTLQIEESIFQKQTVDIAQENALEAIKLYQKVIDNPHAFLETKLHSQAYQLSLLIDLKSWLNNKSKSFLPSINIQAEVNQKIQQSLNLILKNSDSYSQLSPSQFVHIKLNFANSLNQISNKKLHTLAQEYTVSALKVAQDIDNLRLKSESFGILGKLQNESDKAQYYFEKALSNAQSIRAWDLAYQWQQKLGALYKKQNKLDKALQMYEAAIKNLQQVRDNLLSTNVDLQYSFYETVDPMYRDYLQLLISNSQNLSKVIKTSEQLQIAELENYLQCGKLELVDLNKIQNLEKNHTVIHIIDLGNTIEVITQSSTQSLHHHSVDSKLVRDAVENLLEALQEPNFVDTNQSVIIDYSQVIYKQIFAPIKNYLPSSGTLVFNLDKSFQSIPMGLLHDGTDYLIKHYSITTTLGSRIRPPKLLAQKQKKALIAGLTKASPSFNYPTAPQNLKDLPEISQELIDVKKYVKSSVALLNENFTSKRFQQELNTNNFPIVHLTTHGQFSSDPQRTVLLAWDRPINIREFNGWLKAQQNQDPIELLVLSACQTAKGNKRSALGITGVAVQAGARSTVASLWLVDAESTAMLVGQFYQGLNSGLTKAESLRQAQITVLSHPQYNHPYYWSGLILVGSWL